MTRWRSTCRWARWRTTTIPTDSPIRQPVGRRTTSRYRPSPGCWQPERSGLDRSVSGCAGVLGGLAIGVGWWVVLRTRLGPAATLAAGCVLMADPGVLNGQLGYTLLKRLTGLQSMSLDAPEAAGLPQWRILNPVLCWPWWLGFFALTARAVALPTRGRALAAGLMCGVLFYVYFYLWTAAVVGLLLAAALDRARFKVFLGILAVGVVVGLPAILMSAHFQAEFGRDWMLRTDKFLPVDRFGELLIPRVTVVLMAGLWVWVWVRAREWVWLAAIATGALLLLNQTVITGLQIENSHWNYALGPAISTLVVFAAADLLGRIPDRRAWVRQGLVAGLTVGARYRWDLAVRPGSPGQPRDTAHPRGTVRVPG